MNIGVRPEVLLNHFSKYNNSFAVKILSEFDSERRKDQRLITFYGQDRKEIENLLNIMLIENEKSRIYKENNMEGCLNLLLSFIIEQIRFSVNEKSHWDVVVEFINENLHEKITLGDVAEYCYHNPSYFSRLFKQRFGITFQKYLMRLRVEKAKLLLKKGISVDKIIEETGFSSKKMFYKAFLEKENVSVSEYRKHNL